MRTSWYEFQIRTIVGDGVKMPELFPRRNLNFHPKSLLNKFLKMFDNCLRLLPRHSKDNSPNHTRTDVFLLSWVRETKGLMAQILNSSGSQQTPHENCCFLTQLRQSSKILKCLLLCRPLSHKGTSHLPQCFRNETEIRFEFSRKRIDLRFHKFFALQLQHSWCVSLLWSQNRSQGMIRGRDRWPLFAEDFYCGRYIRWFYSYSSGGGASETLTRPWLITKRHKYLKLLAIHQCHGKLHKTPSSNYWRRDFHSGNRLRAF